MQTKLAIHMVTVEKVQSSPPMMMPFTGYASPFFVGGGMVGWLRFCWMVGWVEGVWMDGWMGLR
jgi:hypothetical protein